MAVRTPLYLNGTDLQEMSASMITAIIHRCVYLYGGNHSVRLAYVSNSGSLRRMLDRRDRPGTEANNNTSFSNNNPGNTFDNASSTQISHDKINQVTDSISQQTDTNSRLYPLFINGTDIQAMNRQDMLDTFIEPAIDLLVDGNDRDGTFEISTATSLTNHTLVNSLPIFTDTKFNVNFYSSSEVLPYNASAAGQSTVVQNYYLHQQNQGISGLGTSAVSTRPVIVNSSNELQVYDNTSFDAMLLYLIRDAAVNTTNYRINYEVEGGVGSETADVFSITDNVSTPQAKGTATNKTLNTQTKVNDQDGDVYRSVNFPAGGLETETTYTLKIYRK